MRRHTFWSAGDGTTCPVLKLRKTIPNKSLGNPVLFWKSSEPNPVWSFPVLRPFLDEQSQTPPHEILPSFGGHTLTHPSLSKIDPLSSLDVPERHQALKGNRTRFI